MDVMQDQRADAVPNRIRQTSSEGSFAEEEEQESRVKVVLRKSKKQREIDPSGRRPDSGGRTDLLRPSALSLSFFLSLSLSLATYLVSIGKVVC